MSLSSLSTASLEEIREAAARLCRDYLTGHWKSVNADEIIVRRISGGLSNYLYYVCLPEHSGGSTALDATAEGSMHSSDRKTLQRIRRSQSCESTCSSIEGRITQITSAEESPREVLLRIYGQTHGGDALEAMITESVVFALLSERNLGPKLHGIFPGGRIEEYIPARPLTTAELADHAISMKIAERMGEIHSLNIPMSKEPDWLWHCMGRWIKSLANIKKTAESLKNRKEFMELATFDFLEESQWLKAIIDASPRVVCFCHNDLQEGNILYNDAEAGTEKTSASVSGSANDKHFVENMDDLDCTKDSVYSTYSTENCGPNLIIIDFEYCAYNYRGFDLANHFLEWTFDYSNPAAPFYHHYPNLYPTKQQRFDFIANYLKKLHDCNEGDSNYLPRPEEIEQIDEEVNIFRMLSHLFWGLWSLVNVNSNIQFSYLDYAATRLGEYKQLKQMYLCSPTP